ncbi:MAG: glycoside hydrolase family 88 protein [Verrucomicrobiales bacterium]|nr:glycoside hydrolase family 88 protein [Verrucomicrobiales bacterium]
MIRQLNSLSGILCWLAFATICTSTAISRDWYINPETGDDQNQGSETAPLATAQVAVNRASDQDRVILLPENAIYRQSIKIGSKNSNLVIIGNGVTLTGSTPLDASKWEELEPDLHRIKLPPPPLDRHMLVIDGKAVKFGNDTTGIKGFPESKDLKTSEYRWEVIDENSGWLIYRGPLEKVERATKTNGLATSGKVRNVKVFNLKARHFLNDGFNIHGDARGIQFFEIEGYENFDEGFSAHDTSECWVTDGIFLRNENAIADVNDADTYYENCTMGESENFEILFQGGRHSLVNCSVIPGDGSVPISIAPGTQGGDKTASQAPSTVVIQSMNLDLSKGSPADSRVGPYCFLYYDDETAESLVKIKLAIDASAQVKQSLYNSYAIGRYKNQSPILAWSGGVSGGAPSKAYRILHFGKHAPQEIAPKLLPDNDWLGLNEPLSTSNFPPSGDAFVDDPEAHAIWRWIGLVAPDVVFVPDTPEGIALGEALRHSPPAGVGMVNIFLTKTEDDGSTRTVVLPLKSESVVTAKQAMLSRLARTPREVFMQLSANYGHQYSGSYIDATALLAKRALKVTEESEKLAAEILQTEALPKNGGQIAGTMLFVGIDNEVSRKHVIKVANLAFAEDGSPLEAMPTHSEMSDAIYMACPILAAAGTVSGEQRYFDQAVRHFKFIQSKCQREDLIYRHSPLNDAAWGRGNGFPALGLASTLENFPEDHPDYHFLLEAYRSHLTALVEHQDHDGMWHQLIDLPDSYAELTATCMISAAIVKGIRHGWLDQTRWLPSVNKAWEAVKARIDLEGDTLINVCTGTGKQKALEDYYNRTAILGRDSRGGAMALLFTSEIILLQNQ